MSPSGDDDLMVIARRVLLDALDAPSDDRDAQVLIGAQAIYLHTRATAVALRETTKDSDLALDRRRLSDHPDRLTIGSGLDSCRYIEYCAL
jgi:hypothetical protein